MKFRTYDKNAPFKIGQIRLFRFAGFKGRVKITGIGLNGSGEECYYIAPLGDGVFPITVGRLFHKYWFDK